MRQSKPPINVLVKDEYTEQQEGSFSLKKPSLILHLAGKDRNLHTDAEVIENVLKSKIDPIIQDLYSIALIVYIWDLRTSRTGLEPRYCSVLMSVSNKDKWDSIKQHLEGTLRFLTGDTFVFHFVQGRPAEPEFKFQKKSEECVMLFSGGLDSLAGVKWLVNNRLKPILISHQSMALISGVQYELVSSLRNIIGKDLIWHQIRATGERGSGLTEKEHTQFSRSFLYLTLGAIFALKLGIEREFIFENGVLALNVPLTQSRIYNNTRTAHPQFLTMYQGLLDSLFGHNVTIENPFLTLTKGEVVSLLDSDGFRDLVKTTISCPNVTRLRWEGVAVGKTRHCGVCFPCVVRRVATHYANLWSHDALYAQDITVDYNNIPEEGKTLIFEMMDFARQIDSFSSFDEALNEYPQFYSGEAIDPAELFNMVKRHVAQFKDFLTKRCHQSLRQNLQLP